MASNQQAFIQVVDELVCQNLTPSNIRQFGLKLLKGDYRKVEQVLGEPTRSSELELAFLEQTWRWMNSHDPPPSWTQFRDKCKGGE